MHAFLTAIAILTATAAPHASVARQDPAARICVIVNVENPTTTLTADQVKELFLKKDKTWERMVKDAKSSFPATEKVSPVEFNGDKACRDSFFSKVLGMTADAVARHWVTVQYQSAIKPAKQITEPERVVAFVAELKGSIGFVAKSSLDAEALKKVKVVYEFDR